MSDPNPNPFESWMSRSKQPFWLNTSVPSSSKTQTKATQESPSTTNILFLCLGAVSSVALMLIGAVVGASSGRK